MPRKDAQEALIYAEEGDVIEFAAGEFKLTKTLSLDGTKNVTIRGQGIDKTILNFADQQKGNRRRRDQNHRRRLHD